MVMAMKMETGMAMEIMTPGFPAKAMLRVPSEISAGAAFARTIQQIAMAMAQEARSHALRWMIALPVIFAYLGVVSTLGYTVPTTTNVVGTFA